MKFAWSRRNQQKEVNLAHSHLNFKTLDVSANWDSAMDHVPAFTLPAREEESHDVFELHHRLSLTCSSYTSAVDCKRGLRFTELVIAWEKHIHIPLERALGTPAEFGLCYQDQSHFPQFPCRNKPPTIQHEGLYTASGFSKRSSRTDKVHKTIGASSSHSKNHEDLASTFENPTDIWGKRSLRSESEG